MQKFQESKPNLNKLGGDKKWIINVYVNLAPASNLHKNSACTRFLYLMAFKGKFEAMMRSFAININ